MCTPHTLLREREQFVALLLIDPLKRQGLRQMQIKETAMPVREGARHGRGT